MRGTDYRALLLKYMVHIGKKQGVHFVDNDAVSRPKFFTEQEWLVLNQVSEEAWIHYNTTIGK